MTHEYMVPARRPGAVMATTEASPGDLVAVFIDLENLALGAGEDLPGQAEPIPYAALELLVRDYGNASIRRAYADWSRQEFGRYQESLAQNGITLIQVTRFGAQQKNAADILMAVDAMEVLITHPDVGTFLLVAGDGDYSPLVQRLREFGKRVVGVGTRASASKRLIAVCSEYKYWGTIVAAVNPAVRAEVGANFDIADAKRLITAAMEESPGDTATGGWLKSKMLALDPAFDERNYGARGFRELLSLLPDVVQVTQDRASSDMLISLVPARKAPARRASARKPPAAKSPAPKNPASKITAANATAGNTPAGNTPAGNTPGNTAGANATASGPADTGRPATSRRKKPAVKPAGQNT
jgi:uncharacterized LabA/DUF88 family protein